MTVQSCSGVVGTPLHMQHSTSTELKPTTTHIKKSSPLTDSLAQEPELAKAQRGAKRSTLHFSFSSQQRSMEKAGRQEHVIGIPVSNRAFGIEEPDFPSEGAAYHHVDAKGSANTRTSSRLGSRNGDRLAQGIKEHVTLGPKLYETMKGKLTLGARILQAGGVEKVFRRWFAVEKGEKLLRASQCYLSTTAGPIAGMLFISTERIAFRSDRSLALTTPRGDVTVRVPYKVDIPLRRVKTAKPSENRHRPEQKYVQVVTDDGFEFWFLGFVSFQVTLKNLELAVAQAQ
uniref:GRAM domain-containing protein n=1 Tax=Leersia perrieri TaxID=77586 RepID=A0A0D9W7D5_9ORYZ